MSWELQCIPSLQAIEELFHALDLEKKSVAIGRSQVQRHHPGLQCASS